MFHTPTGNWFLLDETKSNDISLPEFNDSGVLEETVNHNESTNANQTFDKKIQDSEGISAVENDELNSTFDILPENGSIVFDTSQEILSMKNLCRIYETMLTEKQKLSNKELLEKDRKIAAMIDERDNLMDSVSVREKKTESKKGGLKNQALKMMKMEQNFLKIFEEKTDELDLEELKYSELLKSSTKKLKDAEEKIEQLKNNDEEQMEIKQIEFKNKVLEIQLNAMNRKNESLKNLINEFKE